MTGLELFLTVYGVSVVLMIIIIHMKLLPTDMYKYIESEGSSSFIALLAIVFFPVINSLLCYVVIGTLVVYGCIKTFECFYKNVLLKLKIVPFIRILLGVRPVKKPKRKNKPSKVSKTNGTTTN